MRNQRKGRTSSTKLSSHLTYTVADTHSPMIHMRTRAHTHTIAINKFKELEIMKRQELEDNLEKSPICQIKNKTEWGTDI